MKLFNFFRSNAAEAIDNTANDAEQQIDNLKSEIERMKEQKMAILAEANAHRLAADQLRSEREQADRRADEFRKKAQSNEHYRRQLGRYMAGARLHLQMQNRADEKIQTMSEAISAIESRERSLKERLDTLLLEINNYQKEIERLQKLADHPSYVGLNKEKSDTLRRSLDLAITKAVEKRVPSHAKRGYWESCVREQIRKYDNERLHWSEGLCDDDLEMYTEIVTEVAQETFKNPVFRK
jgi:regulator of replication initiation timing